MIDCHHLIRYHGCCDELGEGGACLYMFSKFSRMSVIIVDPARHYDVERAQNCRLLIESITFQILQRCFHICLNVKCILLAAKCNGMHVQHCTS